MEQFSTTLDQLLKISEYYVLYKRVKKIVFDIINKQGYQNTDSKKEKYFDENSPFVKQGELKEKKELNPIDINTATTIKTQLAGFLSSNKSKLKTNYYNQLKLINNVEGLVSFVYGFVWGIIASKNNNKNSG